MFQHQPMIPAFKLDRRFSFGGPLLKGHARRARPVSKNFPLFLSFESRSSGGLSSLLLNERWILSLARRLAARFRIRLHSLRVSSAKDLQILLNVRKRSDLAGFLRSLGGLIPRKLMEKKSFRSKNWRGNFWRQRPFSWILNWKDQFQKMLGDLRFRRNVVLFSENASGRKSYVTVDFEAAKPAPS